MFKKGNKRWISLAVGLVLTVVGIATNNPTVMVVGTELFSKSAVITSEGE